MLQGYGAFRKLKFNDEEVENEKDRIYEEIKSVEIALASGE